MDRLKSKDFTKFYKTFLNKMAMHYSRFETKRKIIIKQMIKESVIMNVVIILMLITLSILRVGKIDSAYCFLLLIMILFIICSVIIIDILNFQKNIKCI